MDEPVPDQAPASLSSRGLDALGAVTDAVEAGAGLPEILRAAARALDASLVLIDRSATVLAVAARSPADERSLMRDSGDVTTIELKVSDTPVGSLRMRSREQTPDGAVLRLVSTLIASEMERTRAPERASEEAATSFEREVLSGLIANRDDLVARGRELGIDLAGGGTVIVARAHPRKATEDDWRRRLLALGLRGARSVAAGAIASPTDEDSGEIVVLMPDADGEAGRRASSSILREIESGLPGFAFAIGRSRYAADPLELRRAANEALLAVNVVERVRELTRLDVSSTDGREKLSLGLKAMRVLGIAPPRGPATEPGAEGGRVPR